MAAAADLTIRVVYIKLTLILLAVILILSAIKYHNAPEKLAVVIPVCALFVSLGMLVSYHFRRGKFIRQLDENVELSSQMDCSVVDGELFIKSDKSTSLIPRDRLIMIKSNKIITLLYRSSFVFNIIPTSVINSDENIRAFLFPDSANQPHGS